MKDRQVQITRTQLETLLEAAFYTWSAEGTRGDLTHELHDKWQTIGLDAWSVLDNWAYNGDQHTGAAAE